MMQRTGSRAIRATYAALVVVESSQPSTSDSCGRQNARGGQSARQRCQLQEQVIQLKGVGLERTLTLLQTKSNTKTCMFPCAFSIADSLGRVQSSRLAAVTSLPQCPPTRQKPFECKPQNPFWLSYSIIIGDILRRTGSDQHTQRSGRTSF